MQTTATPASMGGLTWKAITGRSCVDVEVVKNKNPLDKSHMPEDKADMTQADQLAAEEKAAGKKLKSFFAAATVFENTVRMLGGLGNFWGLIQGVMGATPSGWTSVWAGAGSALMVTDASFQTKMAAVNRNLPAAIDGSFSMVQGMGVMLSAMGLGRIPSLVAVGALVGKIGYGMYRAAQAEKEKEKEKEADKARKAAQKAAKAQQPQPAQPTQPAQPSQPTPATPAPAPVQATPAPATPAKPAA